MNKKKVATENKRLMALFDGADENKMDFIREHVRQLSWYNIRIQELQQNIDKNGITIEFQNGRNQRGLQSNPDLRALIDLQKLASAMVKILLPLVPEKQRKGGKLAELRSDFFDFDLDDEDPEEKAQREREYEERKKKAEEEFQRAVEQQRREHEQRDNQ